jgi:hypothetical protein
VPRRSERLPDLPDTGRRYRDDTMRARLASPGIERFARRRGGGRALAAVLAVAAAVAGVLWLS